MASLQNLLSFWDTITGRRGPGRSHCSFGSLYSLLFWYYYFVILVNPRVPYGTGTSVVAVVAFSPILTVDADVHIILRSSSVRVVGTANIPPLVLAPNVAQHQTIAIVV